MTASNDTPVSDKELDSFYGTPPTQAEINEAILRHKRAFDADDLATIAQEFAEEIFAGPLGMCGDVFVRERRKLIANRASIELFGKVGVIKPEEV